ncbi:MAG: hypothetical protein WA843_05005 [Candidatus Saccharimonadales bacterium]
MNRPRPDKRADGSLDASLLETYAAEHQPSHDQKWAQLLPSDAPLVRQALTKAQQLREQGIDPGDAYLQGIADMAHFRDKQALVRYMSETLADLPETTEPDSSA